MHGDAGSRHPPAITAVRPQWVADEAVSGFSEGPCVPRSSLCSSVGKLWEGAGAGLGRWRAELLYRPGSVSAANPVAYPLRKQDSDL